jgi:hypothetical protein
VWHSFCQNHDLELVLTPQARAAGWPLEPEWSKLAARVGDYRDELQEIIDDPQASSFFEDSVPSTSSSIASRMAQYVGHQGA